MSQIRTISADEIESKDKGKKTEETTPPQTDQPSVQQQTPPQQTPKYTPPSYSYKLKERRTYPRQNYLNLSYTYSQYSRPLLDGDGMCIDVGSLVSWDPVYDGSVYGGGVTYSTSQYSGSDTNRNTFSGKSTGFEGYGQLAYYEEGNFLSSSSLKLGMKYAVDESDFKTSGLVWHQKQVTFLFTVRGYSDLFTWDGAVFPTISGWFSWEKPTYASIMANVKDSLGNARNINNAETFDKENLAIGLDFVTFAFSLGKAKRVTVNAVGKFMLQKVSDTKRLIQAYAVGLNIAYDRVPVASFSIGRVLRPDITNWEGMYSTWDVSVNLGQIIVKLAKKNKK